MSNPQLAELPELDKQSEKLLHVAEILEADANWYRLDPDGFDQCWRCSLYARRSRLFKGMAIRIRRFWGSAFQYIPTDDLHDIVRDGIAVLNMTKVGQSYRMLSDPMRNLSLCREVLALRAENAELKQRLSGNGSSAHE